MRLTIDEYSKHFKMSKQMIHSKLKTKKLNYIVEDDVTYIIVTQKLADDEITQEETEKKPSTSKALAKPRTTVATVLALYQRENQQLKEKVTQLEAKVDKLVDDKEQMLRQEMQKIEQVYTAKDEQLKSILELVNTKLNMDNTNTFHEVEELQEHTNELVELRDYIKTLKTKAYQRKIIKKRFLAIKGQEERIIEKNGKTYLDFSKYDYTDLFKF